MSNAETHQQDTAECNNHGIPRGAYRRHRMRGRNAGFSPTIYFGHTNLGCPNTESKRAKSCKNSKVFKKEFRPYTESAGEAKSSFQTEMPATKDFDKTGDDSDTPTGPATKRSKTQAPLTKEEIEAKLANLEVQKEKVEQEEKKTNYKIQMLRTKRMRLDLDEANLQAAQKRLCEGE